MDYMCWKQEIERLVGEGLTAQQAIAAIRIVECHIAEMDRRADRRKRLLFAARRGY